MLMFLNLDFFFFSNWRKALYNAEMRTGVKIKRKSRINLEDLRDNVEFSSPVDDEVSIDSRLAIEAEVDKLRKELIREKAKT